MAFHYGRDANITSAAQYHAMANERVALLYHLMRVAGCSWVWECDGEVGNNPNTNHVSDGNMEAGGTASYAAVGTGAIAKDSSVKERGSQSLKITANAQNDGARTIALLSMTDEFWTVFTEFDSIAGPTNGQMTLTDASGPFTANFDMVGCYIELTDCGANNGTFIITERVGSTQIKYQNLLGVPMTWPVPPPPISSAYHVYRPYDIVLWAYNDSGVPWDVDVDQGNGSYVNIGTIPDNSGVWTQYHFQFMTESTGSRYIRIKDPAAAGHPHEIYIDSMTCFRSNFEYARLNEEGTDGELINPDRFKSAGYVPDAKDIGRFLFVWDPANPKNSGYYKIIANVGGGVVQVDMRSGTATFTANTGLSWRIVDVVNQFKASAYQYHPTHQLSCGVGFESKHTSKWRMFMRSCLVNTASNNGATVLWASPEDTVFDVSTGSFYRDGPSTMRNRQGDYSHFYASLYPTNEEHITYWPKGTGPFTTRTFIMTDDDCSFVSMMHVNSASMTYIGSFVVGYTGADAEHPGIEEFAVIAKWILTASSNFPSEPDPSPSWGEDCMWAGTTFAPNGLAVPMRIGLIGAYISAATDNIIDQTNNGDNPWSGEEVVYPPAIVRDPAIEYGYPSVREATGIGIYMVRDNLPTLATFDSNGYLHFNHGVCWKWNGEAIV